MNDDLRTQSIKAEREGLLIARGEMRKQADHQKQQMMEMFERMKLKGKANVISIFNNYLQNKEFSKTGPDVGASAFQGGYLSP